MVAQQSTNQTVQGESLPITAAATGETVRITGPSTVVQLRIEVYSATGQKLLDNEVRGGNVFDWHLQDAQAQRLDPGAYVCVVTAKSVSGKLHQKLGMVTVAVGSVSVQAAEVSQLSPQQTQAIGAFEENSSWTIAGKESPETPTVVSNNGAEGQMIRGRGALTFRIGNFFTGNDQEQMRLTEEGNLGIGTSAPRSKLEVAGAISAERFLVVKPNNSGGDKTATSAQATDSSNSVQPLTSGTGTQNRVAKWTDNSGTLGDSGITDTGNNVGIGTTTPGSKLHVVGLQGAVGAGTFQMDTATSFGQWASAYPAFEVLNTNQTNNNVSLFQFSDAASGASHAGIGAVSTNHANKFGDLFFFTKGTDGYQLRMGIYAGNVGIGTTSPVSKLEVNGGSLTVGTSATNKIFIDADATGAYLQSNGTSPFRFFSGNTEAMRALNSGNVGIGTTNPSSRLEVNGGYLTVGTSATNKIYMDADATGAYLQSNGTSPLRLYSGNTEGIRVLNSGRVGIGQPNPQSTLDVAGDVNVSGNAIVAGNIAAKYQDVAEWVPSRQEIAAGTVVILDVTQRNAVTPSRRSYDTLIAGVVSAGPGVLLGQGGAGKVMVATTGRVLVKVDASKFPIKVGDLLVTSARPGEAMKSMPMKIGGKFIHRPGTIIGKALEPLPNGEGKILVLLSLQ
jgi:hypothetical protein